MQKVLALLLSILTAYVLASDFPQWRGPNRDGRIPSFTAPSAWPAKLKLKWQTEVGSGVSTPVVLGNKVWVHSRKGEEEVASCLDFQTGKILWTKSYPAPFDAHPAATKIGKGPYSSPIISNGKLYTLGITAILSCFDAQTGALLWRKDFGTIDTKKMFTGTAMSPLIEDGAVIVQVGDDHGGSIVAFDCVTGEERWRWSGDGSSYASPISVEFSGVRQIIAMTNQAMIGLAPQSGNLLWRMEWRDDMYENIITPLRYNNTLIISNAKNGAMAVAITRTGDKWITKSVWHNPEIVMYLSSPVLYGDHVFGLSDRRKGQFFCLDARTGKVAWITNGEEAFYASFLNSPDAFFILTDKGELIAAKNNVRKFDPIVRYDVADRQTLAHLAIAESQFLIKDDQTLSVWGL